MKKSARAVNGNACELGSYVLARELQPSFVKQIANPPFKKIHELSIDGLVKIQDFRWEHYNIWKLQVEESRTTFCGCPVSG